MVPGDEVLMPTWNVGLRIIVPGLGSRIVPFIGLIAPTIEDAITQARAAVIVETVQADQTAATP
jgi:hypothetical protein